MIRTIISLSPQDKRWLDRKAKELHVTMTELVREAVKKLRQSEEHPQAPSPSFKELLEANFGKWKGKVQGDAVEEVRRMRSEWER